MSQIDSILEKIESGDRSAAKDLLEELYRELRNLARAKLAHEKPGQTLQATALVHEAFIRLVDKKAEQHWQTRSQFFAAAAEAMRRILIEQARHKKALKSGGEYRRVDMEDFGIEVKGDPADLLALDEALEKLVVDDPIAGDIARMRLFAGLTLTETAIAIGIPKTTVHRSWTYARAFLQRELRGE